MNGVLVDSCVLLDLFTNDKWAEWSTQILDQYSQTNTLYINSIVYTELSLGFNKIEELENVLDRLDIKVLEIPREALFLAGKILHKQHKNKGSSKPALTDILIGSHALISSFALMTRHVNRYKICFPQLELKGPNN